MAVDERAADLRGEALKCLELARIAISPMVRQETIAMASRLHEIANSTPANFDAILQAVNDDNMVSPAQPVAPQGAAAAISDEPKKIVRRKSD
jgi:hypothetical protein